MDKARGEKAKQIFKMVLSGIKPSETEVKATIANVNMLTNRLRQIVPKSVEIMVVGSIARGTNLKGDADIDIFMLFGPKFTKEQLSRMGLEYGKKLVDKKKGERFEIKYAEHPYLRAYFQNGIRADIVPASKIESIERLATAVDRTPLHTDFINTNMSNRQRDETRLLKYLLKAHDIYGAEVKIGGFSGYLCELLIYQYGSLLNMLEKVAEMRLPAVLEPGNKAFLNDEGIAKKFGSRFVVIDPVDPNRNVAAAVTEESLSRLVLLARDFISKPDLDYFYGYGFSSLKTNSMLEKFITSSGLDLFLIVSSVPDKTSDVLWPQLRKTAMILADYIKKQGFETYFSLSWVEKEKGFMLIGAPKATLKTRLMKGPDVFKTTSTSKFIKKHSSALGFLLKESTLYSLERSEHEDVASIIKEASKGRIIKRHKDINLNGAKIFLNKIPAEHSEAAYLELRKALSI